MRRLLPFILLFALVACENDNTNEQDVAADQTQIVQLKNKVAQLELESQQKDSVINEAMSFFNEIQTNLSKINFKENEIRIKNNNPELSEDDQEWILQEIQNINFLREENAKNIKKLKGQIASQNIEIKELKSVVDRLTVDIQEKNKEIEALKNQLADRNMEYAELFDEYQEQVELAQDVINEMNTVYFAYGTVDELIENNVLVKEGGFIGIGKKTSMAEDLNEEYFQTLDKTKIKELTIVGNKPKVITDHPQSSYKWDGNKLVILDADAFWKISNFLVVSVK